MFTYKGRINRSTFLLGNIFYGLFVLPIYLIPESSVTQYEDDILFTLLMIFLVVAMLYVLLSLYVRRLHDIGLSAWLLPLTFLPLAPLVLLLLPSTKNNRFGPQPKRKFDMQSLLRRTV